MPYICVLNGKARFSLILVFTLLPFILTLDSTISDSLMSCDGLGGGMMIFSNMCKAYGCIFPYYVPEEVYFEC